MSRSSFEFWEQRYASGMTPWDLDGVPRLLVEYLTHTPVTGRAFVPGCGYGHEIRALHDHGWPVLGLDLSVTAVRLCQDRMGALRQLVRTGDFFDPAPDLKEFTLVYERAFLCALPPVQRSAYARRMRELIVPGGVLCGFFFLGSEPDSESPPYQVPQERLDALLADDFERTADLPVADSLPRLSNKERWQVWRRRP